MSFHGKANVQYILDITPLNEVVHSSMLHIPVQLSSWPLDVLPSCTPEHASAQDVADSEIQVQC